MISAPHSRHLRLAQRDKIRFFVSLRRVGLSVAILPSSGSCHPTSTNRAFGVLLLTSGSDEDFHVNTHLARMMRSVGIPRDRHRDTTRFSIQLFHSFCMALVNSCCSPWVSFLKDTSTRRCFALGTLTVKQSSRTLHRHSGLSVMSSGTISTDISNTS